MAKKKKGTPGKTQTRWEIHDRVLEKVAAYKALHRINNLEAAANILLDKATDHIKLPD